MRREPGNEARVLRVKGHMHNQTWLLLIQVGMTQGLIVSLYPMDAMCTCWESLNMHMTFDLMELKERCLNMLRSNCSEVLSEYVCSSFCSTH